MIYQLRINRNLICFRANAAAASFTRMRSRRAPSVRSPQKWRPVVMHWRRASRRAAGIPNRSHSSPTIVQRFTSVHIHLPTLNNAVAATNAKLAPVAAVTMRRKPQLQLLTERVQMPLRGSSQREHVAQGGQVPNVSTATRRSSPRMDLRATRPPGISPLIAQSGSSMRQRTRAGAQEEVRRPAQRPATIVRTGRFSDNSPLNPALTRRVVTRRPRYHRAFMPAILSRHHQHLVVRDKSRDYFRTTRERLSESVSDNVDAHQQRLVSRTQRTNSRVSAWQFDQEQELVWRDTHARPVVAEPAPLATGFGPASVPGAHASHELEQAVSVAMARVASQPITKIDPALLERLTDDVIRRVDQRMRVERQRRGL